MYRFVGVLFVSLVVITAISRSDAKAQAKKICSDPAHSCGDFKPNELSFKITKKFNFDRQEDRSVPFYAIILKSGDLCGITEEERTKAQELFPANKVFVHRYFCEDFNDNVTYTNTNRKHGFIAVYAGETLAAARKFLKTVEATRQFPNANIRRMQVVLVYQLE